MSEAPIRLLLRPYILGLGNLTTHKDLDQMCISLGLPAHNAEGASKADRMEGSFNAARDETLNAVAEKYIIKFRVSGKTRNELQDVIWATRQYPEIPKRIRLEIAQKLENPLYRDWAAFDRLLTSLWVIDDESPLDAFFGRSNHNTLKSQIEQHVLRNPDDWEPEYLFSQIGAFEGSHRRFGLFLEGLEVAPNNWTGGIVKNTPQEKERSICPRSVVSTVPS